MRPERRVQHHAPSCHHPHCWDTNADLLLCHLNPHTNTVSCLTARSIITPQFLNWALWRIGEKPLCLSLRRYRGRLDTRRTCTSNVHTIFENKCTSPVCNKKSKFEHLVPRRYKRPTRWRKIIAHLNKSQRQTVSLTQYRTSLPYGEQNRTLVELMIIDGVEDRSISLKSNETSHLPFVAQMEQQDLARTC